LNRLAANEQGVDPDDGDVCRAVVEHGRPDLARIMEGTVYRLAIPARLFHTDRRGNIPLGEAGLEDWPGVR
jgi:hypothetical protein